MAQKPLVIAAVVIGSVLVVGGVIAYGCSRLLAAADGPQEIRLTVEVPLSVAKGRPFTIRVVVENLADRARTLKSLDVHDEYLVGVALQRTEPPFRSTLHVPIDDSQSYQYDLAIPPHGKLEVMLAATAVKIGDFAGNIDACVDSDSSCLGQPARTVVEAASAAAAP